MCQVCAESIKIRVGEVKPAIAKKGEPSGLYGLETSPGCSCLQGAVFLISHQSSDMKARSFIDIVGTFNIASWSFIHFLYFVKRLSRSRSKVLLMSTNDTFWRSCIHRIIPWPSAICRISTNKLFRDTFHPTPHLPQVRPITFYANDAGIDLMLVNLKCCGGWLKTSVRDGQDNMIFSQATVTPFS